jgi:hypothetical protein
MSQLVGALGLLGQKVLVLTDGVKPTVHLSARNLPTVHVMPFTESSTYHILWSDVLLIEASAVGHALEPIAESATPPAIKKAARKAPAKTSTKAETKAAAKAAAKASGAAKKTARKRTKSSEE